MPQSYTIGGDSMRLCTGQHWAGQTFRPELSYSLLWVDIELNKTPAIPEPVVRIFLAGADHKPFGDALSQSKWIERWDRGVLGTRRVRFPMTPFNLSAGEYYCIVVTYYPPLGIGPLSWQYDAGDATYTRGKRLSSNDHGATWTVHDDDDHIFTVFGNPPAPPPPPEPPVENWAILDIEQILTATGYRIIVTTNTPCHLYMYWTTTEPEKHPQTKIERGLAVPAATKYCFVVFHENEQEEAGDTIYHTFVKEPWPECETRWFCFRAKIDGEWSSSISPIFSKHRVAPPYGPPETHDYLCSNLDGFLYINAAGVMADYITAWNAATASILATHVYLYTRNSLFSGLIRIYRSICAFHTELIPIGSLITEVKIRLTPAYQLWTCPTNICVTPATNCHLPIIPADYHNLLDTPAILGSKPLGELVDETSFELTLSPGSYPEITPGGLTKFGIRQEMEINMIPCTTGWQYVHMRACENVPPTIKPLLTVTFQPPL